MNIIIITNIPTPYRIPVWKEIKNKIDLDVICISKYEKNRFWEIEKEAFIYALKSKHLYFHKFDWGVHFTIPFSLFFKLAKSNPNVIVITGYDNYQYWEALLYAKIFFKKVVFWNGSTLLSSRSKNRVVHFIKNFFINRFDAYYTYGTKATEYLKSFGVNGQCIVTGSNTVDTDYFKLATKNSSSTDKITRFLYVGQLLERKGLENTIKAFQNLKKDNWLLTIIGTGPDESKLKKLVLTLQLDKQISFVGYKQQKDILNYFSHADVLIMPSYLEVWGLVLNEGLASGLFCLSSKYAGATFDLIEEGINGYIIDPLDMEDLTIKLSNTIDKQFNKKEIKDSIMISPSTEAIKVLEAINKALVC